tara:strand:+ start:62 stop:331 length:270 start_codon:yes stop_codon:yes gene_type:complete
MSNQDTIASQKVTTTDSNKEAFDVKNVLKDWDGLIYTFCYKDKDNLVNGFYQTYCIESWGKINTVMLMELFKDYDYNITVREHTISVEN